MRFIILLVGASLSNTNANNRVDWLGGQREFAQADLTLTKVPCLSWVINGPDGPEIRLPLFPQKMG